MCVWSRENNVVLDIKNIPVVAVVGAIEGPRRRIAIAGSFGRHDGIVVDPLCSAIVELVDDGRSGAGGCVVIG